MATSDPSNATPPGPGIDVGAASVDNAVNSGQSAAASVAGSSSSSSAAPAASSDPSAPAQKRSSSPPAKTLPVRTKESLQEYVLNRIMARDKVAHEAFVKTEERARAAMDRLHRKVEDYETVHAHKNEFTPSRMYGQGYNGFGNGTTDDPAGPRIIYPKNKPRPGKRTTEPLKWRKKDMRKQAEQHEELVPIRIDVDYDKVKLRDTFTWNLHDRLVSVDLFARQLLEDLGLTPQKDPTLYSPVLTQVGRQILDQLEDFYPSVCSDEDALDPELPYSAYKNDEMRILVKLNITIGQVTLVDQFEWEINNPINSPEEFANSMSRDLSLSGEFATAIAHCIREQSQLFTKSLYSIGHPFDGRPVEDPDLVAAFLPSPIPSVFRPQQQAKEYAPYLYELTDADLERNEVIFSREQRRQKRSVNRRGGPQLPDLKERQRTVRTLVVSSVLPGAATSVDESRLYKRVPAGPGPGGRRKGLREGDLSDSDDSEDSAPDSPAMSQLVGTARTRGMRGAATAAQQRMANLGRSETPESGTILYHDARPSRRLNPREARESTEDTPSLVVKLTVSRDRLKRLLDGERVKPSIPVGLRTPGMPQRTPGAMGPPSTPATSSQNLVATPSGVQSLPPGQFGRLPAPRPPIGDPAPTAPPVPDWLVASLRELQQLYPSDMFEGTMRYCALKAETNQVVAAPPLDQPAPPELVFYYLPRIRCLDCPGKVYTPGPDTSVINFEVHLKNRGHREKVDQRVGRPTAPRNPSASAPRPSASQSPAPRAPSA
ncbi:transcription regulatory protein SNF5 [Pyricularia oryzae 70-15]|uniref:SNF5-domain-containing protein n=5 Tax=Pyricularia TaxID=48558 RepID=A0ABQ8NVQ3_PYRGI|nr:transcription regulatory protein SNF5 [Pyricularia oryzae 70-15]ELQ37989.1 transcription regulatory protein SNF5 [Pyricularia oryzae Y34]KAI6279632.1 hypothetical protein MCOR26_004106 [Pyricularia oryzae]KAI6302830.1 hypothetical protein MCOR33_001913 [Pyricularia grisea]EHA50951.1 transcription regulatory protein SNF5 [Pyricularia oryzae 70-15]KAI6338280.1 hypothetical protein MCOR28_008057 [Pyricularia oryzae]